MNVLLIEAPWPSFLVDGSQRSLPPLGIGYLVSALEHAGHNCVVISPGIGDLADFCDIFSSQVDFSKISLIGISSVTDSFRYCCSIVRSIKARFPGIPVVLGGVHATLVGGDIILEKIRGLFDYVLEGEGEYSLPKLADCISLSDKSSLSTIGGLCYYDEANIVIKNPRQLITDLNELCFPRRSAIRQPETTAYSEYGKDVTMITSRGCSHNCSFCSVAAFFNHSWRFRSIDNVLLEIEDIVELYGERFFLHFIDDNFFVDTKRAYTIISEAHSKWPNIRFSFATRSDQVIRGETYIKGMASLGVATIELGIENGSQRILNRYNKKTTLSDNQLALNILKESSIEYAVDYIFFDHYTDLDDIGDNIEFLKQTGLWGYYPPVVYSSLTLYPGTVVAKRWEENEGQSIGIFEGAEIQIKNSAVSRIYKVLQDFSGNQPRIYKILQKCQIAENKKSKNIGTYRLIYKQLSLMPYKLLEDLYILEKEAKQVNAKKTISDLVDTIEKCEKLIQLLEGPI